MRPIFIPLFCLENETFRLLRRGKQGITMPTITLTIQSPKQAIHSYGISEMNDSLFFQRLPQPVRESLSSLIWRDLGFTTLRLWWNPNESISRFVEKYAAIVTIGGYKDFLLAPCDVPTSLASPTVKSDGYSNYREFTDAGVLAYAKLIAQAIADIHAQSSIRITATGVLNEPNDRPIRFTLAQWTTVIKTLRAELNARNLAGVKIVAPEAASNDSTAFAMIKAIKADQVAWAALDGIATHTYNMGANDEAAQLASGKSFWITESSTPGPESDNDPYNAATSAARLIGDLNHGVTDWVWFIGFEQHDPADNGTRLIKFNQADGSFNEFAKFHWLRQLAQAFPVGSKVCPATSSTEGTMTFTYGQKPAILATAATRPDGKLAVAVTNYTSDHWQDPALSQWDREQGGKPAATYTVNLNIPQLASVPTATFFVRKSTATAADAAGPSIKVKYGKATVTIAPLTMLTLIQK
jgi:O-glycosyl hydrolase